MSEVCETVAVKSPVTEENPTGYIVINESDFNPEVHTLFNIAIEAPSGGSMSPAITGDGSGNALPEIDPEGAKKATVAELKEALTAKGIDIPEGAKKAELQMLLDKSE